MSGVTAFETVLFIMQLIVLVPFIYLSGRLSKACQNSLPVSLFSFALISFVMQGLYWIVYTFLRPGTRMPFSAEEIAGSAVLLLLGACLVNAFPKEKKLNIPPLVFSVLFTGLNAALWIIWSGEWVQDIVFGLPYVYVIYVIVAGMWRRGFLKRYALIIAAVGLVCIYILGLISTYATKHVNVINALFYAVLFVFTLLVLFVDYRAVFCRDRATAEGAMYISFMTFIWTALVIYMCAGVYYAFANVFNIVAIPAMYFALKRWASDDIR